MPKFQKKPVVVEAVQFHFAADVWPEGVMRPAQGEKWTGYGYIDTLEGRMIVSDGDWVITGVKGEKYPCKPDIFEATYEQIGRQQVHRRVKVDCDFSDMQPGTFIRHKISRGVYVVTANYGRYVIAVNTVHVSNPPEWEVVSES